MRTAWAALVLVVGGTTACGTGDDRTLTVLAAASLTETFTELAETFEAEHEGVEVELVLGASTALAEQVVDGAPGDVLATADERSMQTAEAADALSATPEAFATNTLTLVTPPDNPAGIDSLTDLASPDVDFVACAATAPCGALAAELLDQLLDQEGVAAEPATEEVDVKAVLARVSQGEADAGLVYRTDAVAAGDDVTEVPIEAAAAPATTYLVAPLRSAEGERADLAAEFVSLVAGDEGQQLLADAGFGEVDGG